MQRNVIVGALLLDISVTFRPFNQTCVRFLRAASDRPSLGNQSTRRQRTAPLALFFDACSRPTPKEGVERGTSPAFHSCVVILSEASAPCFSSRIFATADAQSKDLLFVARPFQRTRRADP